MKPKYHYMKEEDSLKLKKMLGTPYYPFFQDAWKKEFGRTKKCPSYPTVVNVVLGRSNNPKVLMIIHQIAKDADVIKRDLKTLIDNADYVVEN